ERHLVVNAPGHVALPAREEVTPGTDATPGPKSFTNRRGDVGLRPAGGVGERLPAREPGRNRGREGAAGAMGARGVEARGGEARELAAVPEDVRRRIGEVPALDEHVAGTEGEALQRRRVDVGLGCEVHVREAAASVEVKCDPGGMQDDCVGYDIASTR